MSHSLPLYQIIDRYLSHAGAGSRWRSKSSHLVLILLLFLLLFTIVFSITAPVIATGQSAFAPLALPGNFSKTFPLNAEIDQPLSITLTWGTSSQATSYWYCYDNVINGICNGMIFTSTGPAKKVTISGLTLNTTYEWQVRAHNNSGDTYANPPGTTGTWWTFTTGSVPSPGPFSKTSPAVDAGNQPLNLTLTWEPSANATSYEYCYDKRINGTCNGTWVYTTATSASISGLINSTQYEWQVRANSSYPTPTYANSPGATGTWWKFTTVIASPAAFSKTSPTDGAYDQYVSLTLSWSNSNRATSFEYCYDAIVNDACDDSWTSIPATPPLKADISGLEFNTDYEWQVRAKNDNPELTYADSGTWWTFNTSLPPPGAFNKTKPDPGSSIQPLSLTLSWGTSSTTIGYEYCYDLNINSACNSSWVPTTATEIFISGLSYGTQYEWQVRALTSNPDPDPTYANSGTWWTFTTVDAPPGAFNKTDPDGTIIQPVNPTLTWGTSTDADEYYYCIDSTINSLCDDVWTLNATTSVTLTTALANNTQYEWQVRAKNTSLYITYANSGTWWTFTTVVIPPAAFSKSNPSDTATDQSINPVLLWEASSGATSYQYCIDTSIDSICDGNNWVTSSLPNRVDLTGLTINTTYQWQVRALNANPDPTIPPPVPTYANQPETPTDTGTWWTFKTISPVGFGKLSPGNGNEDQLVSPILAWTNNGADSYEYCIYTAPDTDCPGGTWTSTGTSTSVTLSGSLMLTTATTYHWQARAVTAGPVYTYADSDTWWSFITVEASPGSFGKSSPTSTATNQPVSLTLSWVASSDADNYQYCLNTTLDSVCPGGIWTSTGSSTSVNLSGLSNGTAYQWQVRAFNTNPVPTYSNPPGTTGTWWTFTTVVAAPGVFIKTGPATGSNSQPVSLTLSWSSSAGATSYEYCIDSSVGSTCNGDGSWQLTAATSISISGLAYDTEYEWQVRAANTNPYPTYADSNNWWMFKTVVAPPAAFSKSSPVNGVNKQPDSLTLTWDISSGATGYTYCYDTNQNSNCDTSWKTTSDTEATLYALSNDTPYEWQVRAVNANPQAAEANSGTWWTFRTIPDHWNSYLPVIFGVGLDTPVLDYNVAPTAGVYTLTWNAVSGATNYLIWQSTSTTFATNPSYQSSGATSLILPGLNPTHYYFYVVATNGAIYSPPSNIKDFVVQYELEDNDSGATANGPLTSGITYYGKTDDLKDYYKFYLDAPAIITITMTEPAGWTGQMQLFYSDISNRIGYAVSSPYEIIITKDSGLEGWYYLYIATLSTQINPSLGYSFTITITY